MKLLDKFSSYLGGYFADLRDEFILEHDFTDEKILDIGCGNGRIFNLIEDDFAKVYGFDFTYSEPDIENIHFQEGDATEKFPFDDNEFDSVICREVLEHVTDPYHVIKEAHRVLKPEGTLLLTTPNSNNLAYKLKGPNPADGHIFELTPYQLNHVVSQFFDIEKHEVRPFPFNYVQTVKAEPRQEEIEPILKHNLEH